MVPKCRCGCGYQLQMRDARSRERVASNGNWSTWRLRFRCPRCSRSLVRHFSIRSEEEPLVGSVEMYEREAAASLGPIGPNEAHELLSNEQALEELRATFRS